MEAGTQLELSAAEDSVRWSQVQEAWGKWLSLREWDWFLTITFKRPRKDVILALNAVENALKSVYSHPTAFLGAEYHRSGDVHVHGLFKLCRSCRLEDTTLHLWSALFNRLGRSEVVPPRHKADVIKYTTKYCTKDLTDWRILGLIRPEVELHGR